MSDQAAIVEVATGQATITQAGAAVAAVLLGQALGAAVLSEQGPAGASSGLLSTTAAVTCGGHKAVVASAGGVSPASSTDPSHLGRLVGVTSGAALAGDPIAVVVSGPLIEPTWSFAPGPVWLGLGGALTQTPPTSGFLQQVGVATAATCLLVQIGPPIKLQG